MEMKDFNKQSRNLIFNQLKNEEFDLIIIGGGITGASIFRDAILRGFKAALIEARDFSSGTSSKSSKLFHGGLRYIKSLDFKVTKEACSERNLFMKLNSRLVKPIPFMIPVYRKGNYKKGAVRLLLHIYDFLSNYQNYRNHKFLSKKETLKQAPGLVRDGLVGSFIYYDALVNDSRLTLDTIKDGVRNGGRAINYTSVNGVTKSRGKINGVTLRDTITGTTYVVKAETVINATGPFSDVIRKFDDKDCDPLIVLSGGTHLVFRKKDIPLRITTTLVSPIDGRVLFLIKHENCFLFGTTDTWYNGNPENTMPDQADVSYLLASINLLFPPLHLTRENIVNIYCGFRPLLNKKKKSQNPDTHTSKNCNSASTSFENLHPSDVSRTDYYEISPSGLITVTGGKLTTARLMAKKTLSLINKEQIKKMRKCTTHKRGIGGNNELLKEGIAYWTKRCPDLSLYFKNFFDDYGTDAYNLCDKLYCQYKKTGLRDPERIRIEYMCHNEMVITIEDLIDRRIGNIGWSEDEKCDYLVRYMKTIRKALALSPEEYKQQYDEYKKLTMPECVHADSRS
ncbi:MAG: glycerol-3-phosphate dehydrogenase/oxidase [Spirochaetales bacterium]|nr:glycerol-3-phosphate dehydrogenase/oxidase [Spirochaetales bacterium]